MFPKDTQGFAIDNQYYIGSSGLLVRPVTSPGATEADVWLAEDEIYYDYFTWNTYRGTAKGTNVKVPAPLDRFPLLIRGGSVIPTRERPRRSAPLMRYDPFTLTVALDKTGNARGELYVDDGETYAHEQGNIVWREISAVKTGKTRSASLKISSVNLVKTHLDEAVDQHSLAGIYTETNPFADRMKSVKVEKISVLGLDSKPKKVAMGAHELEFVWKDGAKDRASVLTIKNPGARIVSDWSIEIS